LWRKVGRKVLVYYLPFENETFTQADGSRDLWQIGPADDRTITILGILLANVGPDVGDAGEENIRLAIIRGHNGPGSGGTTYTSTTIAKREPWSSNQGSGAVMHNNTTIATGGSPVTVFADGWNIRGGPYRLWLPMEFAPGDVQGALTIVRALTTPNDDISFSGTLVLGEGI
jgi:hypothetical protein